jgi:hypothetical protein
MKFLEFRNFYSINVKFKKNLHEQILTNLSKTFKIQPFYKNFCTHSVYLTNHICFKRKKYKEKIQKFLIIFNRIKMIFEILFFSILFNFNMIFQLIFSVYKYHFFEIFNLFFDLKMGIFNGWLSLKIFSSYFSQFFIFVYEIFFFLINFLIIIISHKNKEINFLIGFFKKFFKKKKHLILFFFHKTFILLLNQENFFKNFNKIQNFSKKASWNSLIETDSIYSNFFFSSFIFFPNFVKYCKVFVLRKIYFQFIQSIFFLKIKSLKKNFLNFKKIFTIEFLFLAKNYKEKLLNFLFYFSKKKKLNFTIFFRFYYKLFFPQLIYKKFISHKFYKKNLYLNKIIQFTKKTCIKKNFKNFFFYYFDKDFFFKNLVNAKTRFKKKFLKKKKK